jgi:predicted HTH transcriptional regulator
MRSPAGVFADGKHQTVGGAYAVVMAKSVADFLSEREGTRLDFKQDLSSMKRVLETVCSFLNTAGGTLVVGVEDQTRVVLGLDDVEKRRRSSQTPSRARSIRSRRSNSRS